jgi:hypothetical protein
MRLIGKWNIEGKVGKGKGVTRFKQFKQFTYGTVVKGKGVTRLNSLPTAQWGRESV